MNYFTLPFISSNETVTEQTTQEHYRRHADIMNQERQSLLQTFQVDHFRVSGTAHLMPEFIVSQNAKDSLIYPQGFLLLEAKADYFTQRSSLESYELRFTLEGTGYLEYNGKTYTIEKGEGYLIDCRKPHFYRTNGEKWTSTCFHFNGTPVSPIYSAYLQSGNVKFSNTMFPNFEMLQMQILQNTQKVSPFSEYKLSCLFDVLLTDLLIAHAKALSSENTPEIIEHIISHLQNNYMIQFSVEDLAHQFGISRAHLSRRFKEYTGFAPHEFLTQLRINCAKRLLKNTELSIEEICYQSGFSDAAYFIQVFKRFEGITPLKFRKS